MTAISIVSNSGLDALSMPNLGQEIGATAMAIYRYYLSKDDLLTAMATQTLHDLYSNLPEIEEGPWEEEIVRLMIGLHRELRSSPVYLELCRARPNLIVTRPEVVPALAPRLEGELQVLRRSGMGATEAMRFHSVLTTYTRGFALMQIGVDAEHAEDSAVEAITAAIAQLDPAESPHLIEASSPGALIAGSDESFELGLRSLVGGIKAKVLT